MSFFLKDTQNSFSLLDLLLKKIKVLSMRILQDGKGVLVTLE